MIDKIQPNMSNYASQQTQKSCASTVAVQNYENNQELCNTATSTALMAYGLASINAKKPPQISLEDMIKNLQAQGKVEGKDYYVQIPPKGNNKSLIINNALGLPKMRIHYVDGDFTTWNGYDTTDYQNGKFAKETVRDRQGNIQCTINAIRGKQAEQICTENNLSWQTSPEKYTQYLKDNNIDFQVKQGTMENGVSDTEFEIYDKNKCLKRSVYFWSSITGEKLISQHDFNEKGASIKHLEYTKDHVNVILT